MCRHRGGLYGGNRKGRRAPLRPEAPRVPACPESQRKEPRKSPATSGNPCAETSSPQEIPEINGHIRDFLRSSRLSARNPGRQPYRGLSLNEKSSLRRVEGQIGCPSMENTGCIASRDKFRCPSMKNHPFPASRDRFYRRRRRRRFSDHWNINVLTSATIHRPQISCPSMENSHVSTSRGNFSCPSTHITHDHASRGTPAYAFIVAI